MNKIKSKAWWKAASIRALKTIIQTFLATVTVTTISKQEIYYSFIAALGAGVLSFLNSMLANLPEVEIEAEAEVTPIIEDEEIIDTSEEDDELYGGGVNETYE